MQDARCSPAANSWKKICRSIVAALLTAATTASPAATWLDSVYLSFDTTVRSTAGPVSRQQVLLTRYQQAPQVVDLGLPANVAVSALTMSGQDILLTPDITVSLAGFAATPRDIVRKASSGFSIFLHGDALGIPASTKIDAIALSGSDVLFSVDSATRIGAISVDPADILRWNGSAVSVLLSAQSLGVPPAINLTGLERLSNGNFLLSFGTAGRVPGVSFRAGEILEYAPVSNQWTLVRTQSQLGVDCTPCKTTDIAAIDDPDVIFRSGMELYED